MNIETLNNDIQLHAKLAKKELKAANKLQHKAQKQHARLTRALSKGDIEAAEKHSNLEAELRASASQHLARFESESSAQNVSTYDLLSAKLRVSDGIGYDSFMQKDDKKEKKDKKDGEKGPKGSGSIKAKEDKSMRGYNYSYPSDLKAPGHAGW